ncbi:hypothetical protein Btru_069520 [Bulinus truncatus]|nr:hypothetical protein Btru_069520 [Bulinus truncatus]
MEFLSENPIPKPSFIEPVNEEQTTGEMDDNSLVPEARKTLNDIWEQVITPCWSDFAPDRPSSNKLLQTLNEIRTIANEIKGDTNVESLKHIVYDVCKEDLKNRDVKKTVVELEHILMNEYKEKYLQSKSLDFSKKRQLGKGHFGVVWEAVMRPPNMNCQLGQSSEIRVAVKTFIQNGESTEANFIREICLACDLDHPNIVKVLHFAYNNQISRNDKGEAFSKVMLVMEHMNLKDLSSFAKKEMFSPCGPTPDILLKICIDIAEGMVYLSGSNIVHRDLAARNVLLTLNNYGKIVAKVSDFGLARNMEENYRFYKIKSTDIMPFYWMPPEILEECNTFSSECDVWSFGITLWEAMSNGTHPRNRWPPDVERPHHLLNLYNQGKLLPKEPCFCDNVYNVMLNCWQLDPNKRPKFVKLLQQLKSLTGQKILNIKDPKC